MSLATCLLLASLTAAAQPRPAILEETAPLISPVPTHPLASAVIDGDELLAIGFDSV